MTSLLTALTCAAFTASPRTSKASQTGEIEYQSIFAATAVLLAGGTAAILVALTQAI
jgi:hypothetical protein